MDKATVGFAPWDAAAAATMIAGMKDLPGACLPILHRLQGEFGYIHDEAVPLIAGALALSLAEVVGVIEFYSDFRRTPPAVHQVQVCLAESCQAVGSAALAERLTEVLGTEIGGRSADGRFDLRPVYCLGNCACSPALMIDGLLYGRVTPDRAPQLLAEVWP